MDGELRESLRRLMELSGVASDQSDAVQCIAQSMAASIRSEGEPKLMTHL